MTSLPAIAASSSFQSAPEATGSNLANALAGGTENSAEGFLAALTSLMAPAVATEPLAAVPTNVTGDEAPQTIAFPFTPININDDSANLPAIEPAIEIVPSIETAQGDVVEMISPEIPVTTPEPVSTEASVPATATRPETALAQVTQATQATQAETETETPETDSSETETKDTSSSTLIAAPRTVKTAEYTSDSTEKKAIEKATDSSATETQNDDASATDNTTPLLNPVVVAAPVASIAETVSQTSPAETTALTESAETAGVNFLSTREAQNSHKAISRKNDKAAAATKDVTGKKTAEEAIAAKIADAETSVLDVFGEKTPTELTASASTPDIAQRSSDTQADSGKSPSRTSENTAATTSPTSPVSQMDTRSATIRPTAEATATVTAVTTAPDSSQAFGANGAETLASQTSQSQATPQTTTESHSHSNGFATTLQQVEQAHNGLRLAPTHETRAGFAAHHASYQVAVNISRAASEKQDSMTIQLDPVDLGRVEIRLDFGQDKTVQASILADRPETLELLQKDARTLERALGQAGLDSSSGGMSFNLRDQSQNQHMPQGQRKTIQWNAASDIEILSPSQMAQGAQVADGRLDVRI